MKNTVVAVCICWLSCAMWAQSTCETRVDAHPKATTLQRVAYCLTPDGATATASSNPGLVFSGVSSPRPDVSYPPEKITSKGGTFKADRIGVSEEFVETDRFPKLSDGRVSQQEILQKQALVQEGKQMAEAAIAQDKCILPEGQQEAAVQTAAGMQARNAKPGRQVKKNNKKQSSSAKKSTKPKKTMQATADLAADTALNNVSAETPVAPEYGQAAAPKALPDAPADAGYEVAGGEGTPADTSYTPIDENYEVVSGEEIPVGTVSYAPAK